MRVGPVVFWVVVAAVLGAAVLVSRDRGAPDSGITLPPVTLSMSVADIRLIETRAGAGVSLSRGDEGAWFVRWGQGDTETSWPANPELVRAGLRVVSAAEFAPRNDSSVIERPQSVTVGSETGDVVLRWGGSAIAGRLAAELTRDGETQPIWLEQRLARSLEPASLLQWRSNSVLNLGSQVIGMEIEMPERGVSLVRRDGVWKIGLSDALPVDRALAEESIAEIGKINIGSFSEVADDRPPVATVRLSGMDGSDRVLELLGGANAAGTRVSARIRGTVDGHPIGPVSVTVNAEPFNQLSPDPNSYLLGTAVDGARVDVASIELVGLNGQVVTRAARTINGWDTGTSAEQVTALVDLLTQARASSFGDGIGAEPIGLIRVVDAAVEQPIEISVERMAAGSIALAMHDHGSSVWFEHTDATSQELLTWLAGELE